MDARPAVSCKNALVSSLHMLLRDEEVTPYSTSVKREHGLSTQNARSALRHQHPRNERRPAESAEVALATQQERKT